MTNHKQQIMRESAARMGWSKEEDALLFDAVREARVDGAPLKAVFDKVAKETGRKPNSIRNYYYARVKVGSGLDVELPHNPAFIPFHEEEIQSLLKTVLQAQAKGMSVRACTLAMGNGDNRAMLRYQNKYRSLLKSNPELVKAVVHELREEGMPAQDPYERASTGRRVGRPKKQSMGLLEVMGDVVHQLDSVEGLDVSAFFESLGALAVAAARGAEAQQKLKAMDATQNIAMLLEEREELRAQANVQKRELVAQRERFGVLLGFFRQLVDVNREFLGMTSVTKMSSLSNYVRELSRNVEDCERWIMESK